MKRSIFIWGVLALVAMFNSPSSLAQTSTTVLISPIVGNPQASGNQIIAALAAITDNSATKPYLIKIEPGVYDFGTQSVIMKPFIDIEGSGRRVTTLTAAGRAAFNTGTVVGADDAELRQLTVESLGAETHEAAVAIYLEGVDTSITDVAAHAFNGTLGSDGILMKASDPRLTRSFAEAVGSSASTGIAIEANSSPMIEDVQVLARDATSTNRAILVQGQDSTSQVRMKNSFIEARGGDSALGFQVRQNTTAKIDLFTVDVRATHSTLTSVGLQLEDDGIVQVSNSIVLASSIGTSYGVLSTGGTNRLKVDNSFLSGKTATVSHDNQLSKAQIGASKLFNGSVLGNVTCAGVWNKSYVFFANTCP